MLKKRLINGFSTLHHFYNVKKSFETICANRILTLHDSFNVALLYKLFNFIKSHPRQHEQHVCVYTSLS